MDSRRGCRARAYFLTRTRCCDESVCQYRLHCLWKVLDCSSSRPKKTPKPAAAILVKFSAFGPGHTRSSGAKHMGNTSSQYSASDLFTMCMGPRWKVALDESKLKTATWNIAAVNNNPFEYWVTHEDAAYNTLMQGVESFIDQPGACRCPRITPRLASPRLAWTNRVRPALARAPTRVPSRTRLDLPLRRRARRACVGSLHAGDVGGAQGADDDAGLGRRGDGAAVVTLSLTHTLTPTLTLTLTLTLTRASDFAGRKIISGFMKDKELGEKRLASMPDRVTNTINTLGDAGKVHRPTVISCYDGDMSSMAAWWKEWRAFEP